MATSAKENKNQTQESLEYQSRLNSIYRNIHEEENFENVLPMVEKEMLALLGAERLTVYQ